MTLPTPPDGRCRQLLQATWDIALAEQRWPAFADLDRRLDRLYEIDILDVLKEMPQGFLYGVGPNSPSQPPDTQEIGLTVAGIAACHNTSEILSLFVEFVQLAVQTEKEWQPPVGNVDARANLEGGDYARWSRKLPAAGRALILQLIFLIIRNEQMGWGGVSYGDGNWNVSLTRDVRRFRNVTDIDSYWSKRYKPWESRPDTSARRDSTAITMNTIQQVYPPERVSSGGNEVHMSPDAPIFIVHGSDTLRAESVARAVSTSTGRKTIILRDEANLGRTLIEKFEQHAAEVAYAVVILTPDDKGRRANEDDVRPRGRQNVVFEMGYFYGLIGRSNVSVLLYPGVEKPSDMDGIAYITFDDQGAWKTALFRELKHVGFDIHF